MIDKRWYELARILVNYSTKVNRGEKVLITMVEPETFPLTKAVYSEVIKAGGLPFVEFQSAYLERDLMLYGDDNQISWINEMQSYGMEWADVYIGLRGARNPNEFLDISARKISSHKKSMGAISAMRNELTRWVLIRVPNESFAQQASTNYESMMEFFFNSTIRNWEEDSKKWHTIKEKFQRAENVRITGKGTDITFSTKGRLYEVADGHLNMPDGEIFTAPVDDSAKGEIYFEFPGVYMGKLIEDIVLKFNHGVVVEASASKNEDLLFELLNVDEGSKRLGEFGVGLNYGIDRFVYDILYDEKIGGTIHLALGRAYKENNGINQSSIHWDIIKDLRKEGAIYLDGKKIMENGLFLPN